MLLHETTSLCRECKNAVPARVVARGAEVWMEKSCVEHGAQKVRLPVVTITSACNLDCPICYVHNKNEGAFHMSRDEFAQVLGHLVADGSVELVNFTGGEPTLHPHFL